MRDKFEGQLKQLNDHMIEMGSLIEGAISIATEAMLNQDVELAKEAIASENEIDQKERDIESLCFR
ncbi:MAG: phosphate transport system regulatory protein PhoU, partial [Clostridiales bacterium]|nr:phosphate transport system regulatory protein PhoU [Clostridiales bacterium]